MTILAGIFSRHSDRPIADEVCFTIERVISRKADEKVLTYRDHRIFFAKVDFGVYGEAPITIDTDGSVSMLAGEPLLAHEKQVRFSRQRIADLKVLHSEWKNEKWDILDKSRGVFCAVHYNASQGSLTLISDKLCIRPLYYWINPDYVVFATALRILENVPMVPKVMDFRAITEIIAFGYPIGVRTPYVGVYLLKAAEIVQVFRTSVARSQYSKCYKWDNISLLKMPEDDLLDEAYRRFTGAIEDRLGSDTSTVAFLSGGLDSRCVVAALRSRNIKVYTYNFSDPETQDQVYARMFSKSIGTIHTESPLDMDRNMSRMISSVLPESEAVTNHLIERPGLVWSGDGGSVGFGCVYLAPQLVALLRQKSINLAIGAFLKQQGATVIKGLFKKSILPHISNILARGIREELHGIQCEDAGRSFHIFLMLNDQRRHLSNHFEEIDLTRIEFHLPFFDSYFLKSIFSFPLDSCLMHHLYFKLLTRFPEAVMSVPWQAYPGHMGPSMSPTGGFRHQWDMSYVTEQNKLQKHPLLKDANDMLKCKDFPNDIISKQNLRLATWGYKFGLRDYAYVIKAASIITRYWMICDGKFSLT